MVKFLLQRNHNNFYIFSQKQQRLFSFYRIITTNRILLKSFLYYYCILFSSYTLFVTGESTFVSNNNHNNRLSSSLIIGMISSTTKFDNNNTMEITTNNMNATTTTTTTTTSNNNNNNNNDSSKDDTRILGGGAINEIQRKNMIDTSYYDPTSIRSHLYHSLEGLHRYPNYLHRWQHMSDIDKLEEALTQQLLKVRQQKQSIQQQRTNIDKVVQNVLKQDNRWKKLIQKPITWDEIYDRILHPNAKQIIIKTMKRKQLSLDDVLNGSVNVEYDAGTLLPYMDEELVDVYSFQLLKNEFCIELCQYIQSLALTAAANSNNNDSNSNSSDDDKNNILLFGRRPVNLDTIGLSWLNDIIFNLFMKPITKHLFISTECSNGNNDNNNNNLDWRNGYITGYAAKPIEVNATNRQRLVTHTDDSEVTLNICLGIDGFVGGLLQFHGLRGTDKQGELIDTYQPQIGKAIIHAGRHFHTVTDVTSGTRYAYIMWGRSWNGIRSYTCPCCWLNRRQHHDDSPCICSSKWN